MPAGPNSRSTISFPSGSVDRAELGRRVRVPLGKCDRLMTGYLVGLAIAAGRSAQRLKPLAQVVDERSLLGGPMLRLTEWMADYYLCPWGQVLETVVPAGVRWQAGTRDKFFVRLAADALAKVDELNFRPSSARSSIMLAAGRKAARSGQARQGGRLHAGPDQSAAQTGPAGHAKHAAPPPRPPTEPTDAPAAHLTLNADQRRRSTRSWPRSNRARRQTVLLHGVTGSGKTEVYIQAIDEVLRYGRQAIVLVPEISLTPQTEQRFRSRFGRVAVLHSHQSDVERHRHWQQIAAGEVRVVVGARSAIFAPTPHLGLMVLDEEHEAVVQAGQRAALSRPRRGACPARLEQIPLVLGLGHAFAGKLAAGPARRLPVGLAAAAGIRAAAAGAWARSTCGSSFRIAAAAEPSAGNCTSPWTRP